MKTLLIVIGLVFVMALLAAGLGFLAQHIAVIVYLVLIALAAATSVFVAHNAPLRT